ncbi:MAG: ASCH domain-containing protein [Patescibacteria group bacterium]|nr:ASCH domain-containing protein [Patescibacteria group bacterium]
MKKLKFRHNLVEEIIAGRKTITWRLFDDKDLRAGDKLELLDSESGEKFAEAEIVIVREKKLGQIEGEDLKGHEKFGSKEEMLKMFKKYYGEKVDWNTTVKIIEFKLL